MQKSILYLGIALTLLLLSSCSKDYTEISATEFTAEVLPQIQVERIEVIKNRLVRIFPYKGTPYEVELEQADSAVAFVARIRAQNENAQVEYVIDEGSMSWILTIYQLIPLIFLLLFILQIVLLWLSIKKILKSGNDNMEKLVHSVIVIFAPLIGPILFLTTRNTK